MARQILARSVEHTPPEATTLALGRQVEFEDLAAIAERRNPIAPIADIADDGMRPNSSTSNGVRRAIASRHHSGPLRAIIRSSSRPGITPR